MEYIKTVQLDLAPEEHFQYVHVKQGDSLLRKLEITITNDGQTYRPSGVDHVWFREQKPDGHGVILESNGSDPHVEIQNAEENVKYVISLTEQCLVAAGRAICDLVLFDSSNGIISTVIFYMMIEASPNVEKLVESDSAFQTLMDVLEEARGLDIHIDDELSETSTRGLQNKVIAKELSRKLDKEIVASDGEVKVYLGIEE